MPWLALKSYHERGFVGSNDSSSQKNRLVLITGDKALNFTDSQPSASKVVNQNGSIKPVTSLHREKICLKIRFLSQKLWSSYHKKQADRSNP